MSRVGMTTVRSKILTWSEMNNTRRPKSSGTDALETAEPALTGGEMALAGVRVIIVLGPLELGGSERQALLLARYLKYQQHADVQVWGTMGAPGSLATLCDEYKIPWRIVPSLWGVGRLKNLTNLARFTRQLRREKPDVILPYLWSTNLQCNLVWRLTGARFCVWNQRDLGLDRVSSRYERLAIRQAQCFIANSNHVAEYLRVELRVEPERVRVVQNGIELADPESDRETWRRRLNVAEDSLLACMVANLNENKDQATLLKAWRVVIDRLTESGQVAILVIAGRYGAPHERLKALAFDLCLGDSVRFLGEVNDISGLLKAVDLGVFSSRSEGSPNGVLECMAAGLAVIATDIPGASEALGSRSASLLAPVANAEAMADAILKLAKDAELRRDLGAANGERIQAEFSPRRMCKETLSVLQDGLAGSASELGARLENH